jgi:predicted secreted protein
MGLTNAQKQQRWRDRNVVVLTGNAATIAERLIEMSDHKKLKKIAAFINDHLRRTQTEQPKRLAETSR